MEHFFPQIQVKTKKKGLHQKWNVFPPNQVKTQKKRSSPKMELFFRRIQVDTYAQMHTRVKLLGGDADVDHSQTIGGDTVKLLGDIFPNPPRVSAPLLVA